ncbi:MAG: hypothetical protein QM784_19760 [Polyangiaceae bacterium]
MLLEPVLGELVVAHAEVRRGLDRRRPLAEELVELRVVLLLEVLAVVLGRQAGVAVRRDDQVWIVVTHGGPLGSDTAVHCNGVTRIGSRRVASPAMSDRER